MGTAKTLAVMQPYIFPYLGYFQLIAASDVFVFYDDVSYIKQGWINRNRIAINGSDHIFTVPVQNRSSNALIKEVKISDLRAFRDKFLKQLGQAYAQAPYKNETIDLVQDVLKEEGSLCSIATLAQASVMKIAQFLGLETKFLISSEEFSDLQNHERTQRLIEMSKRRSATHYLNMEGGQDLYDPEDFAENGITLQFLKPELPAYDQGISAPFIPGLSIIDVMMHNDVRGIKEQLKAYTFF